MNKTSRTVLMRKALDMVRENPRISFYALSNALGLSANCVSVWNSKNLDGFHDKYKEILEEIFTNLEGSAIQSLSELVEEKNFNAVKYTLDYCGFKPVEKQEVKNETTIIVSIDEDEEL